MMKICCKFVVALLSAQQQLANGFERGVDLSRFENAMSFSHTIRTVQRITRNRCRLSQAVRLHPDYELVFVVPVVSISGLLWVSMHFSYLATEVSGLSSLSFLSFEHAANARNLIQCP